MTNDPNRCARCGKPHPRCAGHNRFGEPCGMHPRTGATVCKRHGGHAPQVIAAAERRRREAEAQAAVATFGLPREIDPAAALIEELHRTAGHVVWTGAVIAAMERDDLVWGMTEQTDFGDGENTDSGGSGVHTKHKAGKSVWLQIYQDERKHLAAVAQAALGADAAGRMTAVWEQLGGTFDQLLTRVLDRLELSEAQQVLLQTVLLEEVEALPVGGDGR